MVPPPASNNAAAEGSASTANAIAASQSTDSEKRHYKRLILRARSELENYQRQIGEKDRAIQELVKDREELRMRLRASELASKKVALENAQICKPVQGSMGWSVCPVDPAVGDGPAAGYE